MEQVPRREASRQVQKMVSVTVWYAFSLHLIAVFHDREQSIDARINTIFAGVEPHTSDCRLACRCDSLRLTFHGAAEVAAHRLTIGVIATSQIDSGVRMIRQLHSQTVSSGCAFQHGKL